MNIETELAISAALDGERTDIEMLRKALATDEGREILASFVLLRAQVAADDLCPSHVPQVAEQLTQQPSSHTSESKVWWRLKSRFSWRVATASLAIVALVCAFWLGTAWHTISLRHTADHGPNLTISERSVEPSVKSQETRTTQRLAPMEPPKPTRVLRYVPGSDWHSEF
jgi:hypothetical protein